MKSKNRQARAAERQFIAKQLRRLPVPSAPEELEAKLIRAIPARFDFVPTWSRLLRWPVAATFAVVCVALVLLWPPARRVAPQVNTKVAANQPAEPRSSLPTDHNPQETNPCNIFPPLADWR